MTENKTENKDIINFTETVDIYGCKYIASLTLNEFQTECCTGYWKEGLEHLKPEIRSYHRQVKGFCLKQIEAGGKNNTLYKYGKGRDSGRLYTVDFAIQRLSKPLRDFLVPEGFNDYDMCNCHPRLIVHECKKLSKYIECPYLEEYINNRPKILSENNLTKQQVLSYINKDKPILTTNATVWLRAFIEEIGILKLKIFQQVANKYPVTNTKNYISSTVNKHLCDVENEILQATIKKFGIKDKFLTPMFDGFMTDACLNVDELNEFTKNYGVIWTKKEWTKKLPRGDFDASKINTYENVKRQMEEHCFMVRNPVMWNVDGIFRTEADFKNLVAPYKYTSAEDGKPKSIFGRWVSDFQRRSYNELVNMPYNPLQPDPAPEGTFNTAKPFDFNYILNEEDRLNAIEDLRYIIYHLTQSEEELDYVMKYLAHIIQKPLENPQVILCIKGHLEGCGKDTIVKTLTKVIGKHYIYSTSEMDDVFGTYNTGCSNKLVVQFNEAQSSQGVKFNDKIKGLSTADEIEIKEKYIKPVLQQNNLRIIVNSNHFNPICSGRRPMICQTRTAKVIQKDWWADYYNNKLSNPVWIDSLGSQLLDLDLADFKVGCPVQSEVNETKKNDLIMPIHDLLRDIAEGFILKQIKKANKKIVGEKIDGLFEIKNSKEIGIKKKWLFDEWKNYYIDEFNPFNIDTKKGKAEIQNWISEYTEAIKDCKNGKYNKETDKQVKNIYVMNPEIMLTSLKNGGRYRERSEED